MVPFARKNGIRVAVKISVPTIAAPRAGSIYTEVDEAGRAGTDS
jgi:hypothetical protein